MIIHLIVYTLLAILGMVLLMFIGLICAGSAEGNRIIEEGKREEAALRKSGMTKQGQYYLTHKEEIDTARLANREGIACKERIAATAHMEQLQWTTCTVVDSLPSSRTKSLPSPIKRIAGLRR